MNLNIFKQAKELVKNNKVKFKGSGRKRLFYEVAGVPIELRVEDNKTICTCKQCSIHSSKEGLLCSFKLAVFLYIMTQHIVPSGKLDTRYSGFKVK